ncbi:MAG: hypothetical protein AAF495_04510 [Pseudomonadota bacterium]
MLRASLAEAQATVRSYDTKAQIVGIGYIFALGVLGRFQEWMPENPDMDPLIATLVAWAVVILPILLFGYVLYPSRKMAPRLDTKPGAELQQVMYVDPNKLGSVADLKAAAERSDPLTEVAFELLKVSKLREMKRRRFLRALFAAAFCFIVIFFAHLQRSL